MTTPTDSASEIPDPSVPTGDVAIVGKRDDVKAKRLADQAADDAHDDSTQIRKLRERFSWIVSSLVATWMIAMFYVLLCQGSQRVLLGELQFQLSEKTMLAALGTVTLNVIGLLIIILKFVFPVRDQSR